MILIINVAIKLTKITNRNNSKQKGRPTRGLLLNNVNTEPSKCVESSLLKAGIRVDGQREAKRTVKNVSGMFPVVLIDRIYRKLGLLMYVQTVDNFKFLVPYATYCAFQIKKAK